MPDLKESKRHAKVVARRKWAPGFAILPRLGQFAACPRPEAPGHQGRKLMYSRRLFAGFLAALASGMAPGSALAADTVAIAQFGPHPQLDAVVTAFKAELAAEGYTEGDKISFVESQANFDASLIPQMVTKLQGSSPKLMLTITTPVSQGAKQLLAGSNIPVIFAAVTDPVSAKLVPAWDKSDPMMTGASDLQDIEAILAFTRKLFPDAKRLALPYNPGEDNDLAALKLVKDNAGKYGFEVVELGIDNTNDIPIRIASLQGKADVMYLPASNLLQPAAPSIAAAAQQIKLPIVNASADVVEKGLVPASFEVDYSKVGTNAGKLAAAFLGGRAIAELPPIKPTYEDHHALINEKVLTDLGYSVPPDLKDCNCFVK
jgi:putative ABC transport system substrate-binding protein